MNTNSPPVVSDNSNAYLAMKPCRIFTMMNNVRKRLLRELTSQQVDVLSTLKRLKVSNSMSSSMSSHMKRSRKKIRTRISLLRSSLITPTTRGRQIRKSVRSKSKLSSKTLNANISWKWTYQCLRSKR